MLFKDEGITDARCASTMPTQSAMAAHPNVSIETETGFSPDLLKRMGESFDLVLAMHPDRSGRGEVVRRERAVWIGPRGSSASCGAPAPLPIPPPGGAVSC